MSFLDALPLVALIGTLQARVGELLKMTSSGQIYVLGAGESIQLECRFTADQYNLFDYPIIWRKQQLNETWQVNVMGSLNQPFVSSNRFEVAFTSSSPTYVLELSILGLSREDSGNYTCDVRGPHSILLGQVTHQLYVRAPVDHLVVLDDTVHDHGNISVLSPLSIHLVENHPSRLRCIGIGGYPPPSIELRIGTRDVTSEFLFHHEAALLTAGAMDGLKIITYRTERWTNNYLARYDDDAQPVRCTAIVPGLQPITEVVTLDVDYSPKISCDAATAYLWETGVILRCNVRAKPRVSALFWVIEPNGTTLNEGETFGVYAASAKFRLASLTETQLTIRRATQETFRKYTVVAENNVAIEAKDIELFQKFKTSSVVKGAVPRLDATASHVMAASASSGGRESSREARDRHNVQQQSSSSVRSCAATVAAAASVKFLFVAVSLIMSTIERTKLT